MSRHPITCILPPDLLLRLALDAAPEQRAAILNTLQLDQGFRLARAELAARQPTRLPSALGAVGGVPDRTIYDQQHSTATTPGKLARQEGQPPSADPSVDQAYDNFGYTYQLYWEVFRRDSIDDQGMPILGLVHYGTNYDNAFWDGEGHMYLRRWGRPAARPTPPKASTSSGTNSPTASPSTRPT